MAWTNLLAHLGLLKLPKAECFRDIRKLVSKELSSCGRYKDLQLTELISQMEAIEAERTATGLLNLQSYRNNNNKANRIQSSNRGEGRCFICGSTSHTKDKCTSPCKWCGLTGHKYKDCPKCPEERRGPIVRGRSASNGRHRHRNPSSTRPTSQKNSPHPRLGQQKNQSRRTGQQTAQLDELSDAGSGHEAESEPEEASPPLPPKIRTREATMPSGPTR